MEQVGPREAPTASQDGDGSGKGGREYDGSPSVPRRGVRGNHGSTESGISFFRGNLRASYRVEGCPSAVGGKNAGLCGS